MTAQHLLECWRCGFTIPLLYQYYFTGSAAAYQYQLATRRFYVLQLRTATVHGSLGYSGENVSWKVAASSSLPLVEVNGTTLYSVPRKAAKGEDTHTQMRARTHTH
eukprot:scpid26054/ scgid22474/ 